MLESILATMTEQIINAEDDTSTLYQIHRYFDAILFPFLYQCSYQVILQILKVYADPEITRWFVFCNNIVCFIYLLYSYFIALTSPCANAVAIANADAEVNADTDANVDANANADAVEESVEEESDDSVENNIDGSLQTETDYSVTSEMFSASAYVDTNVSIINADANTCSGHAGVSDEKESTAEESFKGGPVDKEPDDEEQVVGEFDDSTDKRLVVEGDTDGSLQNETNFSEASQTDHRTEETLQIQEPRLILRCIHLTHDPDAFNDFYRAYVYSDLIRLKEEATSFVTYVCQVFNFIDHLVNVVLDRECRYAYLTLSALAKQNEVLRLFGVVMSPRQLLHLKKCLSRVREFRNDVIHMNKATVRIDLLNNEQQLCDPEYISAMLQMYTNADEEHLEEFLNLEDDVITHFIPAATECIFRLCKNW